MIPIPEGVRRIVGETFAEDEAKRYREESDKKLRDLQNTPMAKLGPDIPLPFDKLTRPDFMRKGGYDTPDQEQPSTAAPTFVPAESDPARDYSSLGASPRLTPADITGDTIPSTYNKFGTGGPQDDGPLSEADIIELKKVREDRAKAGVRSSLMQQPGSPDDAAKAIELAKEAGVNRSQVEQNLKSYEFSKTAKAIDQLTTTAPKFRTWMDSARENLEISHDDIGNLSWWEQAASAFDPGSLSIEEIGGAFRTGAVEGGKQQLFGAAEQGIGIARMFEWLPGVKNLLDQGEKEARKQRQMAALESMRNMPRGDTTLERGIYGAFQSAPASIEAMAASLVTKSPFVGAGIMGVGTAGQSFGEAEDAGKGYWDAFRYALEQGTIETATEMVPLKFLIGDLAKDAPLGKIFFHNALSEGIGEQAATFLQDASTWLELHPDKTVQEFFAERPNAAMETLVASTLMTGMQTTLAAGVQQSGVMLNEKAQQARADQLSKTFEAMRDGAKDSKLLKRLPDKYREAVAAATKDGPLENVRVAPEAFTELAQSSGVTTDQLAQAFRIDPNDIVTAIDAGEDVVIPAGNYAAALSTAKKEIGVSGETIHSAFAPNMRLRADDFTAKEQAAMKSVFEEEQKARTEAGTKEQAFADSADRVRESIREQVVSTGLFNTETANTQASLIGEMVTTLAERTGQDPEAFWDEHGFDIVTALTGEQDDQSLAQGLQRQAIQVDDATVLDASEKLPPHEFEVWKEAIKGGSNDEVTDRLNKNRGPDNLMEPKDVARIISRIREKGFEVQKLRTGPALSPETLKIIDLKARGLDNAAIGKAVFPHLSPKERAAKARTASNNNRKAVDARRAELQLSQEKRGTFTPRVGRSVIRLFESANLSTLVHEAAHWYLDTLWRMASVPAVTTMEAKPAAQARGVLSAEEVAAILNPQDEVHPFVLEQVAAILEWQGKSPNWTAMFSEDGTFTAEGRDIQEAFAESFEAYLREGKAPTSALRSVFASFKAWLLRVYKSLTQIGSRVRLNDEIKAVFDRMLATDEAIAAATTAQARDSEALAKALLDKGVITEKQFERTKERIAAAREKAEAELMARLMEDYERNQKAWWRDQERQVRREVQSEVDERPEQRAYAWLTGKGWRDTRAAHTEAAADEAQAMATLEQYDEALAFSRYYEPDATDENLKALYERMRADGVEPLIMLFKAPNGRVIAFHGSAAGYSHDLGREIMGLGDLKLQHGIYDPRKGLSGMMGIDWYATSGTQDTLPKTAIDELAQFAPRNAVGAPIHSLMRATLMDIGGESKEDIWRETGWAQTKFGDWVWEIPGKPQFNFNPEAKAQRGRLDQMIEWPELFEAMPILRDVYLVASVGAQSGRFDSAQAVTFNNGDQKIVPLINARGSIAGSNTLMETIQHEIQHAIQVFSGFASTGASAAIELYRGTAPFENAKARFRQMEAKLFEKYGDASPELFEPLSEDEVERIAALEVYSHNHGEWQARQVEWRSRMPAEWRWANPPGTEVPGTKEDVNERHTWATLNDLRAAQGVQRSGDAGGNPAARVASALAGDQAPAAESAGATDGQDNGGGEGTGSLAQRVSSDERAAEIQRVLDYFKANPEAAYDASLSSIMAVADASARGVDQARIQFRSQVSATQARRLAAINAGVMVLDRYLADHPNAFETMRVGEIARRAGVPVETVQRAKAAETGSLAQLSAGGVNALRSFVESSQINAHIQVDNYEVYIRKARRLDETGNLIRTLDLSSVTRSDAENASFTKGRTPDEKPGDFRELVTRLEQEAASHGFDAVYDENVLNEFLPDVLRRYGYTEMPGGFPPSFIKHVDATEEAKRSLAQSSKLDMSEAARMQRAREQGFDVDTPLYHGTNQPVDSFDSGMGGRNTGSPSSSLGIWLTDSPAVADDYAAYAGKRLVADTKTHEAAVEAARKNAERLERAAQRNGNWDAYEAAMAKWEELETGALQADDLTGQNVMPVYTRLTNPKVVDFGGNPAQEPAFSEMVKAAKAAGHDGVIFKNLDDSPSGLGKPATHYVVFDPKNVRGKFASFDPSQSGSSKLLAQTGDTKDRTVPPPNLPPMRLNLQAVREEYGEDALASLPPEVVAYSAQATDLDQFVQIAVDVRKTLQKKRPKSLWKFLATRRVVGSGNDKLAFSGIRDEGGELLKIIGEKKAAPGLIADEIRDSKRVRSYTIEHAAEAAWAEGYFTGPSPPTPAEFLDALRNDVDGTAVSYAADDIAAVQEREAAEQWQAWFDENGVDITGDPMFGLRDQLAQVLSGQQEGAISPDEAAPFFKMPDGNALLQGLKEGPKRNQLIREEVRRRMIATHGDIFNDGTIMREAEKFARNEIAERQIEVELEALSRATGQQAAANLAKQQAIENLRSKQVREVLNYNQWLTLEQRWGKKALEAANKGDFEEAARFKKYQLLNMAMFREGRKIAEQIEATRKHLLDYGSKTKQQRLFHAGRDYAEQMNGLLSDYQFRNESRKGESKRAARAQWLQGQMAGLDPFAAYNDPTKSPTEQMAESQAAIDKSRTLADLAEGVDAKNYKSLTVEELMGVKGEADMIWRLATLKDRLIKEGERRRLSLAADDIAAEIETNQPKRLPREPIESDTLPAKTKRGVLKYFAMHRTLQSLARQFAGDKDGGQFWNYIVRPLNEGYARLALLRKQMGKDLEKLFGVYTKQERARFFKERIHFTSLGVSLTKQGRLAVALNWGNEKNRQRLMDSTGWDEAGIQSVLDTLDKRDWDFVQSVWDYLDTWFPETNKVHEAVHGVPMDKVQPLAIATRFGAYKGGYYPIMFDQELSSKAGQRAVEAETKGAVPRVGDRTQPGFGKKRVEGRVTLPLRLSVIDVVSKHLDQVATSIATEEAFFDAGRLLKQKTVEDAIVQRHGRQVYNTIINTVVTAKFGLEGASGILNHLRNGATVVGLGWKVATAALQPLGVSNSIVRVGGYWMVKGYAAMGTDAVMIKRRATWVTERSDFMKSRRQSQSPELSALRASMRKGVTPKWVTDNLFALMSNVQFYSVDVPTWYGGFFKAKAAGMSDADAVAEADQAVIDAQGGGEIHQTAAVQTGAGTRYSAALRLLTNFMSYMVTTYNLATQRARNANSIPKVAALSLDMVLLLAIPVAGKMALDAWTKGGGGGDDDDPLWEKYGREQAAFLMSPFVGLSQIAGASRGDEAFSYRGPAGLGIFAEATNAAKAAAELDFDESFWRPANRVAGMFLHYPAAQLDATIRGAWALWNGETDNPGAIFFGPPPAN
jgi:hypothetical protein